MMWCDVLCGDAVLGMLSWLSSAIVGLRGPIHSLSYLAIIVPCAFGVLPFGRKNAQFVANFYPLGIIDLLVRLFFLKFVVLEECSY